MALSKGRVLKAAWSLAWPFWTGDESWSARARIAEDLDRFTSISLALSIGLMNSVVTLVSFLFILWTLSGSLAIPLWGDAHIDIPGYMVFAAIIYAVGGTWLTQRIGSPLVGLL